MTVYGFRVQGSGVLGLGITWTPKVCRIIAFYRLWVIFLPTFGGLGRVSAILGRQA